VASTNNLPTVRYLVLSSDVLPTAKQPRFERRNQKLLEHYGYLLGGLPGVSSKKVTMTKLREQLEYDIYGVVAWIPQYPFVLGAVHVQAEQTGFGCTIFTPTMVAVDTFSITKEQVQVSLQRLLYKHLRKHLVSRWWYGLSSSGYPSLVLSFRPLLDCRGRVVLAGHSVCCKHVIEYTDLPVLVATHPKETLIPRRR
jgi:hypothetical protein